MITRQDGDTPTGLNNGVILSAVSSPSCVELFQKSRKFEDTVS